MVDRFQEGMIEEWVKSRNGEGGLANSKGHREL